jgi:hypothetical protein
MEEMRNEYKRLAGRPGGKILLRKLGSKLKGNTKLGLRETVLRLCIGFLLLSKGTAGGLL